MRLAPLLVLSLAGCSLYFGSSSPPEPPNPGGPPIGVGYDDGGLPGGPLADGGVASPPADGGGAVSRCGAPEVHVIGIYETSSDHTRTGDAHVTIDRPGSHVLVLSAYEPTNWHVRLAAGATVRAVQLFGFGAQTVDLPGVLPGVAVMHGTACGYSYPYNGGGCDTNQLLTLAKTQAGVDITSFHGCYQATDWTLRADGTATSNCNTAAGYTQSDLLNPCLRSGG